MFFYTFMPKLFNMSLTASVAIVLVILLRLLLKKAPKVISYALWGVVLFRLLCPMSIGSDFSVYNLFDAPTQESGTITSVIEYVPSNIVHTEYPSVTLPVPGISDVINEALPQGREQLVADPLEAPMSIATYVWMIGVLGMVIYSIVSYIRLRRKLSVVVPLRDNIFIADDIKSPFVVGLFRPKIYLPCNLGDKEQEYIILHEQHHIKRLDHVMKALAFLALAIHWFNPLVWVAFILASEDMEMSCDEAVIRKIGGDVRADYSASLLTLATGRRIIAGTPLAFGEGDTKGRINNLSKWKKPAVWVVIVAVIACIILAVCLLTNPEAKQDLSFLNYENLVSVAAQSDTHPAAKSDDQSRYIIDGPQLAQFLDKASWTAQTGITRSVQRYTDKNSKSSFQITLNGTYLKVFDTDTANIYDPTTGKDRYYRMADGDYEKLLAMLSLDNEGTADNAVAGKTYVYEGEGIMGSFAITLYDDGTFTYYEGMASSYIGVGSWEQDGDSITMTDDGHGGYGLVNHFKLDGDDIVFVEQDSDNFVYVKVKNGEKFHCTGEAFKQNDGSDGTVQIMPSRKLSLNDVIMLSQKGYDLTWSDFEQFEYIETGSGLYIRVYEINEMYELWIGGGWIDEDPMYIYLALADDLDTRIDIRDGGVTEFIGADHSEVLLTNAIHDAILEANKPSKPDGLYHCASFALLSLETVSGTPIAGATNHMEIVTVYGLALHQGYGFSGHTFHEAAGSHIPVAITFEIVDGKYVLKDYWTPRDGSYYVEDIRNKFPDEIEDDALDTQKYIRAQIQECYDKAVRYGGVDTDYAVEYLFEVIESSPATSSRPTDYIDAHPIEYRELTYYGSYTLRYIFSQFLEGNQTGLRGHLMRAALDDIAPEAQLRLHAETGQEYFDEWKAGAIRVGEQHDMDWIKENQPAIWLLLQMLNE